MFTEHSVDVWHQGALLDFKTETSPVKIMSDSYYVAGDPILRR
jgi:hypothetical protein